VAQCSAAALSGSAELPLAITIAPAKPAKNASNRIPAAYLVRRIFSLERISFPRLSIEAGKARKPAHSARSFRLERGARRHKIGERF
jgi:hypothetical protein